MSAEGGEEVVVSEVMVEAAARVISPEPFERVSGMGHREFFEEDRLARDAAREKARRALRAALATQSTPSVSLEGEGEEACQCDDEGPWAAECLKSGCRGSKGDRLHCKPPSEGEEGVLGSGWRHRVLLAFLDRSDDIRALYLRNLGCESLAEVRARGLVSALAAELEVPVPGTYVVDEVTLTGPERKALDDLIETLRAERDSRLTKESVAKWIQSEEAVQIAYGATEGHGSPYIRSILARLADRLPAAFGEESADA